MQVLIARRLGCKEDSKLMVVPTRPYSTTPLLLYVARRTPVEQRLPLALGDVLWLCREGPVRFRPRRRVSHHHLPSVGRLAVAKLDLVEGSGGSIGRGTVVGGVLTTSVATFDDAYRTKKTRPRVSKM